MTLARKLFDWGVGTAIPFWADAGWDQTHGGYLEALDMAGKPVFGGHRRVRVQARQIYVFARAEHEGWAKSLGQAREAAQLLRRRAWAPDGKAGWVHELAADGSVVNPVRDLYDHAFVLLAIAWLYRASGDAEYLEWAAELLDFLDEKMISPDGGYVESIGAGLLPRRQNPHMHLFEALMALYDATGDDDALDRAGAMKHLFDDVFFDPGTGVLREFFDETWGRAEPSVADIAEPGHLAEWVWLLHEYARLAGTPLDPAAAVLMGTVRARGANPVTGVLKSTVLAHGPGGDDGSRSWMQTEWIRAAAVMADSDQLDAAISGLFRRHLDGAPPGGWIDQIDATGAPVSQDMPASTLYHMVGSVLEAGALTEAGAATLARS